MKPEQLAKGETWRCPQAQGRCLIVECSTLQQGRTARILRFFFVSLDLTFVALTIPKQI